jgi:chromatin remodeling complex protein RSC6
MNKELTRHAWKVENGDSPAVPTAGSAARKSPSKTLEKSISKKEKLSKASAAAKDSKKKSKLSLSSSDEPKKLNGLQMPKPLATKLADFMGTKQASRLDVNKKIWEHIKSKSLQSAENKTIINCDARLRELLGQDTVSPSPHTVSATSHISAVHIVFPQQISQPTIFKRVDLC